MRVDSCVWIITAHGSLRANIMIDLCTPALVKIKTEARSCVFLGLPFCAVKRVLRLVRRVVLLPALGRGPCRC